MDMVFLNLFCESLCMNLRYRWIIISLVSGQFLVMYRRHCVRVVKEVD